MFDDSEDDDDDDIRTEYEEWFDCYYPYFPEELHVTGYDSLEVQCFYRSVYCPLVKELVPAVRQLMEQQFPAIKKERRPAILKELDRIAGLSGRIFLIQLFELVYDENRGVNLREKYPLFDTWLGFYANPGKPYNMDNSFLDKLEFLTDEQKKELVEEIRREVQEAFDWKLNRRKAFYDIIQPLAFKYYKRILDIEPDSWIIYSVFIREEYETYEMLSDHIATFIQFEFPEEDLHIPYSEFSEKFKKIWVEKPHLRNSHLDD